MANVFRLRQMRHLVLSPSAEPRSGFAPFSQVCARGHRLLSATWFCIGFQIMTFAMMAAMNREHMNSEEEEIPRLDNDTGAMLR